MLAYATLKKLKKTWKKSVCEISNNSIVKLTESNLGDENSSETRADEKLQNDILAIWSMPVVFDTTPVSVVEDQVDSSSVQKE